MRPVEQLLPNLPAGELTAFCTELTSITQQQVDGAQELEAVLRKFHGWLATHNLPADSILPVTCGDWDLKTMLPGECERKHLDVPEVLLRWCNIKQLFEQVTQKQPCDMVPMLNAFGLRLEGHHHSGRDDCWNVARIFQKLCARSCLQPVPPPPRHWRPPAPPCHWWPPAQPWWRGDWLPPAQPWWRRDHQWQEQWWRGEAMRLAATSSALWRHRQWQAQW